MASHGANVGLHDATIFWNELTDEDFGGVDHLYSNIDTADAVILATHGVGTRTPASCYDGPAGESPECDYTKWSALLTTSSGDPNGNCKASTSEMSVGNYQAEYFDVFACESLEKKGRTYTRDASYRLHQWHGFSGIAAVGSGTSDMLDDYVEDAFDGPAAMAWVENLTSWNHWGGTSDVCGTALVMGSSFPDAYDRALNEQYGVRDYADPNSTFSRFVYYGACDPPSPIPGPMSGWSWGG